MGHPEELSVVGLLCPAVEGSHHVIDGHDLVDGVQVEGRDALQGHFGDYPERSEAHPGHITQVGVVVVIEYHDRAVANHQS